MGIYSEHIGFLKTLNLFAEKRGSENSMVKNVVKKMKSSKFFWILFTLKLIHLFPKPIEQNFRN